jgi:hypothetical protein
MFGAQHAGPQPARGQGRFGLARRGGPPYKAECPAWTMTILDLFIISSFC